MEPADPHRARSTKKLRTSTGPQLLALLVMISFYTTQHSFWAQYAFKAQSPAGRHAVWPRGNHGSLAENLPQSNLYPSYSNVAQNTRVIGGCQCVIASTYGLDARYGTKRETKWVGYKVHRPETCE